MPNILGIDAGQPAIKVQWRAEVGSGERALTGLLTDAPILPQIARVAREASAGLGELDVVSAGVSGLTDDVADPDVLMDLIGGPGRVALDAAARRSAEAGIARPPEESGSGLREPDSVPRLLRSRTAHATNLPKSFPYGMMR